MDFSPITNVSNKEQNIFDSLETKAAHLHEQFEDIKKKEKYI